MKTKNVLSTLTITTALALGSVATATAGLIHFSFPAGGASPTYVDPNTVGGSIIDGPGAGLLGAGVSVVDTLCFLPGSTSTSAASAITNGDYFQFTLAPGPGLGLSLGSFTFDAYRTGTTGTTGFVLRSSRDSFAADIGASTVTSVGPAETSYNINLSTAAYQNITTPTTFRLYGYSPSGVSNGICFDNISVNGQVAAAPPVVPEPGTALYSIGVLAAALLRRRGGR